MRDKSTASRLSADSRSRRCRFRTGPLNERPAASTGATGCKGRYSPLTVRFRRTARISTSSIYWIWCLNPGNLRLRIIGIRSRDVTAPTLLAPCEFSGFDESSPRRGRSGVRSGSCPGERVCLSARPDKTRNKRRHRPSAWVDPRPASCNLSSASAFAASA